MLIALLFAVSPLVVWGQSFRDGTYLVGTDIPSGVYRAPGGAFCYWERLSGLSGDVVDVLANDLSEHSRQIVEIKATDKAFKASGCGTWELVDGDEQQMVLPTNAVVAAVVAIGIGVVEAVEPDAALIDQLESAIYEAISGDIPVNLSERDEQTAKGIIAALIQGIRDM
jgi:hypothetical protein